ncbi:MAG: hypothetical protein K8R69_01060 [Deltaproteobacteria bacterium]|nr:hypothetical protein [Deltaproteobacteria bacterium]
MENFIRQSKKIGNFLMKNKGKIALALGSIAAAEIVNRLTGRKLREYLARKSRKDLKPAHRAEASAVHKMPQRDTHQIYRAPQIPKQNLMRH